MNAEALIGMVLGTCTLQKLIGQGGMGAVYLAQQSRPRRQVAVKVLLPLLPSSHKHQAAFLERFRRETDAAAALEHPNIMPVHEYGERDGLAYLVMPYMSGGTLRDEMERVGQLPLSKVLNYLDQIAAALELAHERGVVHRDVKPANILMTQERRLVLSDFGLVKILTEGQSGQARLTGAGVPVGTPDYMAPEQVIGSEVDARADLYSLGCVLYHMVTGTTPFQGEMPMQIAMQHLSSSPPPPRTFRADLPFPAEHVILRAMEKRPTDRYTCAQDLAGAFRMALTVSGVVLDETQQGLATLHNPNHELVFTPRGLFDPKRQLPMANQPMINASQQTNIDNTPRTDIVAKTRMTLPSFTGMLPPSTATMAAVVPPSAKPAASTDNTPITPTGLRLGKTGLLRQHELAQTTSTAPALHNKSLLGSSLLGGASRLLPPLTDKPMRTNNNPGTPQETSRAANAERLAAPTGLLSAHSPSGTVANADNTQQRQVGDLPPAGAYDSRAVTSALIPVEDKQGTASMIRLTQSMKIVKVPIAGQPGRYLTGLLPVIPATAQPTASEAPKVDPVLQQEGTLTPSQGPVKTIVLLVLVLLIVFGSGIFLLMFSHNRQPATDNTIKTATTPVAALTAAAQASATVSANIILTDPLSSNDHNWKVFNKGPQQFVFKDGAYSISNNDTHAATALLPDETLPSSFIYTLTLNEIKGDDTSVNNQFGLVIRYTERKKDGRLTSTFYLFDIASAKSGGEYQFWKYDDSFKNDVNPWTKLWNKPYGKEYHFGHGPNQINTFKIMVQGSKYSFVVNDKPLGSTSDNALNGGQIGMLVNQKGTEVAFSNLLLTYQ